MIDFWFDFASTYSYVAALRVPSVRLRPFLLGPLFEQQLGIRDVEFHRIGIPDEYVHHGAQEVLRAQYDLDANGIAKRVREFLGSDRVDGIVYELRRTATK